MVVLNSAKARVTGKKAETKTYAHYTRYHDGQKVVSMEDVRDRRPNDIVKLAVRRMLPKTKLGRRMLTKLKIYPGAEHPHAAQNPAPLDVAKR